MDIVALKAQQPGWSSNKCGSTIPLDQVVNISLRSAFESREHCSFVL